MKLVTKNVNIIKEETIDEFESKKDMDVIDKKTYNTYYYVNNFLKRNLRETTVRPDYIDAQNVLECYNDEDTITSIYDHMCSFRLNNPLYYPRKTINVTFTFPYNKLSKMDEYFEKPWLDKNFKLYLANPRLFQYYQKDTVGIAHVKDEDPRHGEGTTEKIISHINSMMVEETGESLFYEVV